MQTRRVDPLDQFVDLYEKGFWNRSLQTFISHPDVDYDSIHSRAAVCAHFVNYADACVFKGAAAFKHMSHVLQALIQEDKHLTVLLDEFLRGIKKEYLLFTCYLAPLKNLAECDVPQALKDFFALLREGVQAHSQKIEEGLQALPAFYQPLFKKKVQVARGWEMLQQTKPDLCHVLAAENWVELQPWHPFAYALAPHLVSSPARSLLAAEVPLIFLEPLEHVDYRAFLEPYCQNTCIVVFETVAHLFQLLQFPSAAALLANSRVYLYILELYPHEQMKSQQLRWQASQSLLPIFMLSRPHLEAALVPLIESLKNCLLQPLEAFEQDSSEANCLYAVAKRALWAGECGRYGKSRSVALSVERGLASWHDPHKGLPLLGDDLGPLPKDYLKDMIEEGAQKRVARVFAPKNKIRLAHVVPQIVDGGHAPTKLLKMLCTFADRHWFDIFVLSTERLSDHLLSYPIASYSSLSSLERGSHTLALLHALIVHTWVDPHSPTYELAIKNVQSQLKYLNIDIAVFHGPDEIHSLVSCATKVPIRLLFDHGTLPAYCCFDLAILSTEEAYTQHHLAFRQRGMESCVLPFSIDVRQEWEERPYTRQELGLPEESFVMTTISHHLDDRLTKEMCQAIGEILRRCPQAIYAPIGGSLKEDSWRQIFAEYGVNERVIFLGDRANPSQYVRSMHLYLNEFPFGSGLALLEAMAAGCPIVSLYDEKGPQQARYAATYFGLDRVIRTGQIEDYITLACQLIQNPVLYREWSDYAKQQYTKRIDAEQYVRRFERIIEQFIARYQSLIPLSD